MKSLLLIALALVSVSAFSNDAAKMDHKKAAMEACKEMSKDKKAHKACMEEHMKATATTETAAAPATTEKHEMKK